MLKVIHLPTTVGGNAGCLSAAERGLGLDSRCVALTRSPYAYPADETIFTGRPLLDELRRYRLAVRSLSYDVIHYNFGSTALPIRLGKSLPGEGVGATFGRWCYNSLYAKWVELADAALAHRLGKVVAVTFQGDDARQGDFCREHFPVHFVREVDARYYRPGTDEFKRERIARFERYADLVYSVNPDLMHVLPGKAQFMPYASVDPRIWKPAFAQSNRIPHVLHAPSHRAVKGTGYLIDAVNRLRSEGIDFRFTLVEGVTHEEAKRLYEGADLLVDQLLAGWYGALAVELMALGKPVISYIREEDLKFIPSQMRADLPVISCPAGAIYDVLRRWLTCPQHERDAAGQASRAFVERWHDPHRIASDLMRDYERVHRAKHSARSA